MGRTTCPHCNFDCPVDSVAYRHAEAYGGGFRKMLCNKCKKPILVTIERVIAVTNIQPSDHKPEDCDWPEHHKGL